MAHIFIGEYEHTLDEKKRASLPKSFKDALGKKMILTQGLDNCLLIFPREGWEKMIENLRDAPYTKADTRDYSRFLFSSATELATDGAGRILIPDTHKRFAGLKRAIVFAGVSNRVEIWDAALWKSYKTRIEKQADAIAEKLGEMGVL